MSKYKTKSSREELVLFPESIDYYIPESHLVRLLDVIISKLDFSRLDEKYSEIGQNSYEPKILTAILFYGYTIGINSSRKLSDACIERLDFRYLTFNQFPSYKTISEFRRENLSFLKDQFTNIVLIGMELGLADFGNIKVSLDGTKIRANASSKKTKNLEGLKKLRERIEKEIEELLKKSEAVDRKESNEIGKRSIHELPRKLQSKRSYISSINKAMEKLTKIQEDMKREEIAKHGKISKSKLQKIKNRKINITDHDAKFMKERNGCIRTNYNGQISVDEKKQFILANNVVNTASDRRELEPMVLETESNINGEIQVLKADSGYESLDNSIFLNENHHDYLMESQNKNKIGNENYKYDKINFEYNNENDEYICPEGNILPFIGNGKDHGKKVKTYKCQCFGECANKENCSPKHPRKIRRRLGEEYLDKNLARMQQESNRIEYRKRMHTVEPVFGNIKFNNKFYYFLLRGLEKVQGEFSLMCSGHNIKKIFIELKRLKVNFKETIEQVVFPNENLAIVKG